MPKDVDGIDTHPSYDRLVEYLSRGYSPEDSTLQMLAWVVATKVTKNLGFIVTREEVMNDAIKTHRAVEENKTTQGSRTIQVGDFLVTAEVIDGFLALYVDTTEGEAISVCSTADASGWGGLKRPAGLVELSRQ